MSIKHLKIPALLLCGLLLYNSLGYFMVLSVMRMAVRQQKWAQIHTTPFSQLTVFTFSKNAKNSRLKIVNKREIKVDGKLYDIARKSENCSTITYYCVYDQKEESLIAKTRLLNSNTQQTPSQKTAYLILEKIIKTGVINQAPGLYISFEESLLYSTILFNYDIPYLKRISPPPQPFC